MSSPVILKGHLFGLAQRKKGSLVCLDLQSGKVKWPSPGRVGEYVSIVGVENRLHLFAAKSLEQALELRIRSVGTNGRIREQTADLGNRTPLATPDI